MPNIIGRLFFFLLLLLFLGDLLLADPVAGWSFPGDDESLFWQDSSDVLHKFEFPEVLKNKNQNKQPNEMIKLAHKNINCSRKYKLAVYNKVNWPRRWNLLI